MLDKQMKIFQEGGMMDNSGEVVNGTEVPAGSLREEVADDIPARLSEGEFVIPADVVRFIGLEKLMKMRDAAKAGLERMQEMGQMGNAQEVANPDQKFSDPMMEDDSQFESDIDEIIGEVETEKEFSLGGMASGTDLSMAPKNPAVDVRYFKSDDGKSMYITFINGKPMTPIPDGFKEVTAEEARQVKTVEDETKPQTKTETQTSAMSRDGLSGDGVGANESGDQGTSGGTHGGIAVANSGITGTIGSIMGGIVAGPMGALGGKVLGQFGIPAAVNAETSNAISANLGVAGFSNDAVSAAQAAAAEAAGQEGATAGSVAAAAAQAAANVDNTDPLDAMFAVTNNFSNTPAPTPSGEASSSSAPMGTPAVGAVTGDDATGPEGESGGGVGAGGDDGGAAAAASEGMSGPDGGFGGVWAKGGLINKRKRPAKKQTKKGIAAKK